MPLQIEWRDIPGWEGFYQVSDDGHVKGLARVSPAADGRVWNVPERELKVTADRLGYCRINLVRQGVRKSPLIHRLVMLAFVGPCPEGLEVRHLNGNPVDNRLENLSYGTRSENQLDAVRHGTHKNSKKTRCSNGHEFTSDNTRTYRRSNGCVLRFCRTCERDRARCRQGYRGIRRSVTSS